MKTTCCSVTVFAFATGEGGVLLCDCLRVPPVRATCCVTVFRVPPVKATSSVACFLAFSVDEDSVLLRNCFCGYHW